MGSVAGSRVVELGGVEGKAERGLDTGAEGLGVAEDKDTSVVDLGLDKGGVVKVSLGADLEGDGTGGGLGVVDSLGTSLDVLGDLVVVRGGEGGELAEGVEGHGVLWGRVAESSGVAGDGTGLDIVRCLTTDEETVVADNGVSGEGGALGKSVCIHWGGRGGHSAEELGQARQKVTKETYLEEVNSGTGVDSGLLVDGSDDGSLGRLGGVEGGVQVKLEATSNGVLELNLGAEEVGGGPGLKG